MLVRVLALFFMASGMWSTNEAALLNRTIDALERALRYMQGAVSAINLDGVFCVRRVAEQLQAFLKYEPQVFQAIRFQLEHLLAMARQCADEAMLFVQQEYTVYSLVVGFFDDQWNSNPCDLSDECLKEKTKPNQRGYELRIK
ncbi:hypothetical protein CEXT_271571 [Caerostris extrusa]|uniref:Uncharacterized protein n=1 Tax=Caerostris extrusa TaxID=172846 RepID=A0AAV4TPA6_CAEEX|nr:hypothetical protein CEXT_271571 [Caerostris extrusa]